MSVGSYQGDGHPLNPMGFNPSRSHEIGQGYENLTEVENSFFV